MDKSRLLRYTPHPLVSGAFLIAFVFYYFNAPLLFSFPDVPWHVASGDLIRLGGGIPDTDPWSYTAQGHPWYNISWLWDYILSAVAASFGLEGLYFFIITLHALLFGSLCHYLRTREHIKEGGIGVTIFVGLMVLWPFVAARPQIISFLMIVFFLAILHSSRGRNCFGKLWLLPPLMALWVNMHGGFLAGFILIGAYFFEAHFNDNFAWRKRLFIIGFVCGLATFINPYGWEIIIAVHRTLGNIMAQYIAEWRPLSFGNRFGFSLCVGIFVLTSNIRDRDIPIADKLLAFFWFFAALSSIRNFAIFALVSAPYMAIGLSKTGTPRPFPDMSSARLQRRFTALVCVAVFVLLLPPIRTLVLNKDLVNDSAKVPLKAIEYIAHNHADIRFYNSYDFGGYLIFYARDTIKVFSDGRAGTAYPDNVLGDVVNIFGQKEGWQDIFKRYGINGIIVGKNHPLANAYSSGALPDWERVYEDDVASVFIKN